MVEFPVGLPSERKKRAANSKQNTPNYVDYHLMNRLPDFGSDPPLKTKITFSGLPPLFTMSFFWGVGGVGGVGGLGGWGVEGLGGWGVGGLGGWGVGGLGDWGVGGYGNYH